MKNLFFLITFILSFNFTLKANWYEIDARGKVVPIGKVAKLGKISVFIISTSWCSPCIELKNRLKAKQFDMDKVDFYYILIADAEMKNYEKSVAYEVWRRIENLEAFPMIYITAPTTNIVSKFGKEEYNKYDRILKVINGLNEDSENFNLNVMLMDYNKTNTDPKKSLSEDKEKQKKQEFEPNLNLDSNNLLKIRVTVLKSTKNVCEEFDEIDCKYFSFVKKKEKYTIYYGGFEDKQAAEKYIKYFHEKGYTGAYIDK